MTLITSRQNPIVRAYRGLADEPDANGARLLLDGVHLVRDAHAAGLSFESVAIAASHLTADGEEGLVARVLQSAGVQVVSVADAVFPAMSPVKSPSGIVAIAHRPPSSATTICNERDGFTLVAIDVQDPGNLGGLIRVAEAGGVTGVIVTGVSAQPFSWKALRGSMGSALRLPVASAPHAASMIECLHSGGARVVASVPRGGRAPDDIDWKGPVALLLGGEGHGLHEDVVLQSDDRVTIPMARGVDSLNVAVAGAILVYTARRQRS